MKKKLSCKTKRQLIEQIKNSSFAKKAKKIINHKDSKHTKNIIKKHLTSKKLN